MPSDATGHFDGRWRCALALGAVFPQKSGLTIVCRVVESFSTQDLEPAETLFRLGSIPTSFRHECEEQKQPGRRKIP